MNPDKVIEKIGNFTSPIYKLGGNDGVGIQDILKKYKGKPEPAATFIYNSLECFKEAKKRLDLNDLLKRAADQKKHDRKFNLLIFCGAASVVVVFYLLFNF